jgi:chaperone modulatory protein CbpM
MTDLFTEEEAIAHVARLTRTRLVSFMEAEVVSPMRGEAGLVFRRMDLVRMELLCELSEAFELKDDALGVVISLIDQLHGARAELRAMLDALAREPDEVRVRVGSAVQRLRRAE